MNQPISPSKHYYKVTDNSFAHIFIDFIQIKRKTLFIRGWCDSLENNWELIDISCSNSNNIQEKSLYQERLDVAQNINSTNQHAGFNLIIRNIKLFTPPEITLYFENITDKTQTHSITITANSLFTAKLYWQNILFVLNNGFGKNKQKKILQKEYKTLDNYLDLTIPPAPEGGVTLSPVQVILPVYNGYEFIINLIPKLLNDEQISQLIIINDCSTDTRINEYLDKLPVTEKLLILQNQENLGFVRTVNKAMELVTDDFIILNSDVDVPSNWVNRLITPIKQDPQIATVTPFTNAGTIMSFPAICQDNNVFNNINVEKIDSYFQLLTFNSSYTELPTGVGYCMAISYQALQKIGKFNAELFGKGYGEENDWCQRAIKHKYKNIALTNLYVYHAHGASFPSVERELYIQQGLEQINRLYPKYHQQVQEFIEQDELKIYRDYVLFNILLGEASQTDIIIDHCIGGGTNSYRNELIEELKSQDITVILLTFDEKSSLYKLQVFNEQYTDTECTIYCENLDSIKQLLNNTKLHKLYINNFVSYPSIQEIIEFTLGLEVKDSEYFLHDYFALCQSHTLLNYQGDYCDIPTDKSICDKCLLKQPSPQNIHHKFNSINITEWRELFNNVFQEINSIRAFSQASANIFLKVYPELQDKLNIEHHKNYYSTSKTPNLPAVKPQERVKIAFVGGIGHAKGAGVIQQLAQANLVDIVIIGKISPLYKLPDDVTVHGEYKKEQLPDLLERYQIHATFVASVWPETYNFVTDELMALELPVFCFDIGAHADRLRDYPKGHVLSRELIHQPELLSQEIISILN